MKKALSLILALVLCLSLCACGSNNSNENEKSPNEDKNSEYVGIWKPVVSGKYAYLYIYKDGTGDYYKEEYYAGNYSHYNRFTWEVSDGYLTKQGGCEADTSLSLRQPRASARNTRAEVFSFYFVANWPRRTTHVCVVARHVASAERSC